MPWCLPEPITPDPTNPLDDLSAEYFFDLGELIRFISLVCARWAYVYGSKEGGEKRFGPDAVHPCVRISHVYSHSSTRFSILLRDAPTNFYEFKIPALWRRLSSSLEACQWYEQLCDAIDQLIAYGLAGPPSKAAKRRVEVINKIKICENCAKRGHVHPKPATSFEGRWLCYGCVEVIEKEREEEQRRQARLAALTEKYGDAERAARQLAREEERKKLTPSLRFKILERDRFSPANSAAVRLLK